MPCPFTKERNNLGPSRALPPKKTVPDRYICMTFGEQVVIGGFLLPETWGPSQKKSEFEWTTYRLFNFIWVNHHISPNLDFPKIRPFLRYPSLIQPTFCCCLSCSAEIPVGEPQSPNLNLSFWGFWCSGKDRSPRIFTSPPYSYFTLKTTSGWNPKGWCFSLCKRGIFRWTMCMFSEVFYAPFISGFCHFRGETSLSAPKKKQL